MEQEEKKNAAIPNSGSWKIANVYSKVQVELFWSKTDEKTRSDVHVSAQPRDGEDFQKKMSKRLSKAQLKYLSTSSEIELERLLLLYLKQAEGRKESHDRDTSRWKRARKGSAKFLNEFHSYVQAYSGIIHLMNGAGQNYGDAAYRALALLLVVAIGKENTEDVITSMLFTLREQYSRIQMLKEVYATARVKQYVAEVYRLGIEFVHQAALYYSIGTFHRFFYLLSHPPSVALEGKVTRIKKAIMEMRMEMETLDRVRLNNVERKLGDIERKVDKVDGSMEVLHTRAENVRLESLQQLLGADIQETEAFVRNYDDLLVDTFGCIRRLPPFDAETQFLRGPVFETWKTRCHSSLIMLHGTTVAPDCTQLSWHSPAATRLVLTSEEYLSNSRSSEAPLMLYCFCQTAAYYDDHSPPMISACAVISQLIYQLLSSKNAQSLLRDDKRHAKLKRDIEELGGLTAIDQLSRTCSTLANLMTNLELKKVFIVLDRVDQIRGTMGFFLRNLLAVVQKTKCVLKILLTVRTTHAFDDAELKENLPKDAYTDLNFDQD